MKKRFLIFLIIGILILSAGCQNNPNPSESTQDTQTDTEVQPPVSEETPAYTLTELKLDILPDKETHTLDFVVFENNIFAIVSIVGESDALTGTGNPYYFVTLDKMGKMLSAKQLSTPQIDEDVCCLKQFTIGQDGNIYALKTNYIDTTSSEAEPKYEENVHLVSWTPEGDIRFDTKLEPLDFCTDHSVYIRNLAISKNGDITLCCIYSNGSHFMVSINTEGTITATYEAELHNYTATHFKRNNDGSLYSIRADETNNYFISYDANTKTFSKEITVSKDLDFLTNLSSQNSDSIYYFDNEGIHNYTLASGETTLVIDFAHTNITNESLRAFVPINATDYICTYDNGTTDGILRIGFLNMQKK